jgi:methionyl-tRNA formyltransferase
MTDLKVIFMGTPDFAVPTLAALCAAPGIEVVAVYTQPPRRAGRGKRTRNTPVHQAAVERDIPVYTPVSLKAEGAIAEFAAISEDADAAVVVAYGLILPSAVLQAPRLGCFNLHGSILPRWRGAAPIQRAVMAGDAATGVCIMAMDEGLDTGAVYCCAEVPIGPATTAGDLHDQLAELGAPLMVETLRGVAAGRLRAQAQAEAGVTYASKIDKAEARLDWSLDAATLDCLIRGLSPAPGAWCEWQGERIKVLLAAPESGVKNAVPGTVLDDNLLVATGAGTTGEGALRLMRVQRAGKGVTSAVEFLRGNALGTGQVLE